MTNISVALLGLGAMGSRMAARLLAAGHSVTVYNRSPGPLTALVEAGATAEASPRAAAASAEIVISMVRDDQAAAAVWLDPDRGALAGMQPGALAIEASTVTPAWIDRLGREAEVAGLGLVDAPVLGSRPQAEAGALISLVGGSTAAVERARPALASYSGAIHHVGPCGAGARLKLAVNALFGAQVATLAELLASLARADLPPAAMVELLAELPVVSPVLAGVARRMAADQHAPQFPIELVGKDLGYQLADAEGLGAATPMTAAAEAVFAAATTAGWGDANLSAVVRRYYFSATM